MSTTPSNPVRECQPSTETPRHTPLPWIARGQHVYDSSEHTVSVAYCGVVHGAGVCRDGKIRSFGISEEEAVANAAFIATLTARAEQDAKRIEGLEAWQRARLETADLHLKDIMALEAALRPFANLANGYDDDIDSDDRPVGPVALKFCRNARAALQRGGA